jgi:lactoylglutathione lyase
MKVKKLLHTRMRVSDLDETIRFYTTVLGLEVIERKSSPRGSQLAFLKTPNSDELIELTSFPPSGITDGPTKTSSGSRFIFIDAPDGYEIELIERPATVHIV